MPLQSVPMLLLPRGKTKDQRSMERLADTLGDIASVSEVDERRVFAIEIEAEDMEAAIKRAWNAVAVSSTTDNIKLLEHPDLPEHWRHLASPARG